MSKRLSRNERKAQTRAELIDAAARVFARSGYHGTTIDDVAEEAGFTKGAFYSNFESKEDVFVELVADRGRNWTLAVARAYQGEEPLPERLRKGGKVLTHMVEHDTDWMRLAIEMWSQSVRDPRLRERLATAYEECRQIIARGIDQVEREFGVQLPISSDRVATLTMALTDGFVLQQLADRKRLPAGLLAEGINVLITGLMAVAGVPAGGQRESVTGTKT
jgi:AcrR family transcriptional regulator